MLPRRYLDEIGYTSSMSRSWKGIIAPMLQEAESPPLPLVGSQKLCLHLHAPCRVHKELVTATQAAGEEELDDSEDEDECQWKLY